MGAIPDGPKYRTYLAGGTARSQALSGSIGRSIGCRSGILTLVNKRSIDLFNDPPWPVERSTGPRVVPLLRPFLLFAFFTTIVFAVSMALPWYVSAESPGLSPLSRWLNLGSGPGTQEWAGILLGPALAVALGLQVALRYPNRTYLGALLGVSVALLVMTILALGAHLSVNPGPALHVTWGAWIDSAWDPRRLYTLEVRIEHAQESNPEALPA